MFDYLMLAFIVVVLGYMVYAAHKADLHDSEPLFWDTMILQNQILELLACGSGYTELTIAAHLMMPLSDLREISIQLAILHCQRKIEREKVDGTYVYWLANRKLDIA